MEVLYATSQLALLAVGAGFLVFAVQGQWLGQLLTKNPGHQLLLLAVASNLGLAAFSVACPASMLCR